MILFSSPQVKDVLELANISVSLVNITMLVHFSIQHANEIGGPSGQKLRETMRKKGSGVGGAEQQEAEEGVIDPQDEEAVVSD